MGTGSDISDSIEVMKAQLELMLKRIDSAESKISVLMKQVEENNKMLSAMMETMQQMGLLAQPYRKSEQKADSGSDRAYW